MLVIECGILGCPYGAGVDDEEGGFFSPEESEDDQLLEHLYLRVYLKSRKWVPILVGLIQNVKEVWICPDCQRLIVEARESPKG